MKSSVLSKSVVGPAVGSAIAGIVCITLAVLAVCLLRRRSRRPSGTNAPGINAFNTPSAVPPAPAAQAPGRPESTWKPETEPITLQERSLPPIPPESRPPETSTARRASVLYQLVQMNVPPELIVQVLDNLREDGGDVRSGGTLQPASSSAGGIQPLPRGAASPAPPSYDFNG